MQEFFPSPGNPTPFKLLERRGRNLEPRAKEHSSLHHACLAAAIRSRGSGHANAVVVFNMQTGEYPAIFKNGWRLPARFFLYRGQKLLASGDNEEQMTNAARRHSRQSPKPVILHDEAHGWIHTYTAGREIFPHD
jgi:hypothetical protein